MKIWLMLFIPLYLYAQQSEYPDTVITVRDSRFPCLVTHIDKSGIDLNYNNQKSTRLALVGIRQVTLGGLGIVYTKEKGFNPEVKQLQIIIKNRNRSPQPFNIKDSVQWTNPPDEVIPMRRTAILLQLIGPEVLGIFGNLYIHRHLSVNFGVNLISNQHIGLNIYLTDRISSAMSFYTGVQLISYCDYNPFGGCKERQRGIYIPLGYEFITGKGFALQVDIGPNLVEEDWDSFYTNPILGSIKIGFAPE